MEIKQQKLRIEDLQKRIKEYQNGIWSREQDIRKEQFKKNKLKQMVKNLTEELKECKEKLIKMIEKNKKLLKEGNDAEYDYQNNYENYDQYSTNGIIYIYFNK